VKNPVLKSFANADGSQIMLEVTPWHLYDYFQALANTTMVKTILFQQGIGTQYTPLGGTPFAKNIFHSNLNGQGAQLPNPQRFLIRAIYKTLRSDIWPIDLANLEYQTYTELDIGDRNIPYYEGILVQVPGGNAAFLSGATPTNTWAATSGWPVEGNKYSTVMHDLVSDQDGGPDIGIVLSQGQNFSMFIDPTLYQGGAFSTATSGSPGGVGIQLWLVLDGALARTG
jgi:hypothetical protein